MRRLLAVLAAVPLLALAAPAAHAATRCQPVTSTTMSTITVSHLCPHKVRVQLALVNERVGSGEGGTVLHNVITATARAHRGQVTFTGLAQTLWEWRTVRHGHTSPWTVVQLT